MTPTVHAPDDVEELLRLYSRQQHLLFDYFESCVNDSQLAADLLQDTVTRAIAGRAGYHGSSPMDFNGWFWTIARNTLTDARRHLKIQRRIEANLARVRASEEDAEIERIEDLAAFRRMADAVTGAVAALPEDLGRAVQLHVVEDLSYQEMAERLGITPAAARTRVSRGQRRVAEVLQSVYRDWRDGE